jgi:hypothetical protein
MNLHFGPGQEKSLNMSRFAARLKAKGAGRKAKKGRDCMQKDCKGVVPITVQICGDFQHDSC